MNKNNENSTKNTKILKTLGLRLLQLRKAKGKTLEEASKDLSISISSLGSYETSVRKPDPDKLSMLADYYDVSIDYLLGRLPNTAKLIIDEDFDFSSLTKEEMNNIIRYVATARTSQEQLVPDTYTKLILEKIGLQEGANKFGNVVVNNFINETDLYKLFIDIESVEEVKPLIIVYPKDETNTIMIFELDAPQISMHLPPFTKPFPTFEKSLIYSNKLSDKYNVITVVSWIDDKKNIKKISAYYYEKDMEVCKFIDVPNDKLLTAEEYLKLSKNSQ